MWFADVSFPLTPALSLGEREERSLPGAEHSVRGILAEPNTFLPLPKGEGRGEGKQNVLPLRTLKPSRDCRTLRVLRSCRKPPKTTMKKSANLLLLAAALGCWMEPTSTLGAASGNVLWQIGTPDKSYAEFAIARNHGAFAGRFDRQPLVFEIGRSQAGRDWPFIQPGPADSWAGGRVHPFTVRFRLADEPRGMFTLRVELSDVHSQAPPTFAITVGGRTGQFHLQPGGGDASLGNPAAGKPQQIELALPAGLFRQGTNDIVLAGLEGSWVQYDAVTLLNDPEGKIPEQDIKSLTAQATPFFIHQDGRVRRAVDVNVVATVPGAEVKIRVEAGGETIELPLQETSGFGSFSQEVGVPDSAEPLEAKITAQVGARSRTITVKVTPQRQWRVFVAASAHTDVGYTDLQPKCAERHCQNTDLALELMEKDPGFKWNLEVAWQAENYLATRTGEKLDRFLRFTREGRLGVQALYCNILTGLCSHEAGCRLTWLAHNLKTRYGIPYRSAMISDVPTQEASLPMLLAQSGIRYFSSGINNDRAYTFDRMQGRSPCWWEGPDGSRVLMMYMASYAQASGLGLDQSVSAARARVLSHLRALEAQTNYSFDAVFLHGAVGDNSTFSPRFAEVAKAWNERYEFPKIILSHNAEFFEYIEKKYGDRLPVFRGSAGTYWEDGAGSSAAETALCRRAKENVASAEKLLALTARLQPQTAYPKADFYDAWRNSFLYDEHTWGAYCSISEPDSDFSKAQWKIKAQFAVDADREAAALLGRGADALAALVKTEGRSLVVINSASWPRTDIVHVKLPEGLRVADPEVTCCDDASGTLLLVKEVPACGYRVLKLEPKADRRSAEPAAGTVLESAFYRVAFDPANGAVTSVFDKELNRELVDPQAPHRLNEYLYVAGGKGSRIVMNPNGPEPKLTLSTPEKASLRRVRLGELGERMVVETSGTMAPRLVTEVTVWNHLRRVDIVNRLTKTQTYDKEAVYFSFPFAAAKPVFRYECPAGIVNANTDMLPGACLDWFTVQHFVEIESGDAAIAWATPDAPLACFQDINRGQWLRRLPMNTGHLYAYVMNNYWHTNYKPGQGGELTFRFSITSRAKADNAASARFGWAASNPLFVATTEGGAGAVLPAGSSSLVEVAEPNVILIGAKQSEVGGQLVLRLWEVNGQPTTAHLRLGQTPARKATACNLVEEPQGALEIRDNVIAVPIRASGLATVIIE
jgi:alpha-mannosidase